MQKTESVKLSGQKTDKVKVGSKNKKGKQREVMVKELSAGDIADAWDVLNSDDDGDTVELFITLWKKCTGMSAHEVRTFYPSELKEIYEGIVRVNSAFFGLPQALGIEDLVGELKRVVVASIVRGWQKYVGGMDQEPSTTDSSSS